MINDSLACL